MARTAKAPIGSRTERKAKKATLKPRAEPYYSQTTDGVHVGYRSAFPAAGQWVARKAIKKPDGSPSYTTQVIGTADDILDSEWTDAEVKKKTPGLSAAHLVNVFKSSVLTYSQAVIVTNAWAGAATTTDKNITVDAIADLYIQSLRIEGGKKDSNVKTLESTLNHARAKFGNVKVEALTMDMIEAWRNELVNAKNIDGSSKYAKTTVNRTLQIFKACLNYAYSKNKVSSDRAWRGVKQIKPQKGEKVSRKLVLTPDQVDALVDATDEQALKDLIIAGFFTGARYGELVAAKVADLNGSVLMVDGKTGERSMHLSSQAQEHFAKLAKGKKSGDLLLPDASGKPWNKSIQNRFFRKACVAAGLTKDNGLIEDPVFYTLRHSYATIALDTGISPSVIAENIGNSEKVLNGFYRKHIKDGATAKLIDFASPRLKVVA
jgi:integrase